jgi:DNA recombination protein RmuC
MGTVALVFSAAALVVLIVLALRFGSLVRATIEPALGRIDQGLRDELVRGRGEAASSARDLREEVRGQLEAMRAANDAKLEMVRAAVDEKLQATLEQGLADKFKLVSERVDQVIRSVGEMQQLASSVGDLKRVLTNVKTRGTWGEVSLGALLEEALAPEQYERNVEIRPGSGQRVEFAIRLPGADGGGPVYLPIDAKFPTEDYERLSEAAERADPAGIEAAARGIEARIRQAARDISEKYVAPPYSTDFALLFLPTEGLYAEVLRRPGLVAALQRDCRVVAAGPTTLLALVNSLRMGFRTLAIEKRSSEVWQVLRAVKTEFGKYGEILERVQNKLQEASRAIDSVAVRRRQIERRLAGVETLPEGEAGLVLGLPPAPEPAEGAPTREAEVGED